VVIRNNYINQVGKAQSTSITPARHASETSQINFDKILKEKLDESCEVKFSKHAEMRLQARNIRLSQQQRAKINEAVKKAEAKGVKDSLVLMDDVAFVINVKNKTVITAVSSGELKQNVFTNIDGAVII